jgi:peptidyl-prolyl cis-trans isomerase C
MKILNHLNVLLFAAAAMATAQNPAPAKKAAAPTPAAASKIAVAPKKTAAPAAKPAVVNSSDPVVLSIGDQKMTKSQYEAFVAALPEQLRANASGPNKRKFVEQFAEMKSLAYEARRQKLDQKPEIKQIVALQTDNLLASELYKNLNSTIKVDDAAERAYFEQHKSEFEQVKASHILVRFKDSPVPAKAGQKELTEEEALAKAKEIREKLVKGANFAELAKAESDDTGSGANGGELGSFGHGQMVPQFDEAAFKLPVGQLSEPVKTQFGYHIIKVEEHASKGFEDVKPQIESRLKPELAKKAVENVKKTVPVTIDDQYFGK